MAAYYNEFDKNAVAWLRELIKRGLIADGVVDDRSILDVDANDVKGFTQHHWFAGIGGWSLALRQAGWPDDRPVCSASLPCQPFSQAGKQLGKNDERHLLPHFIELVKQSNWQTIIGEQVPAAIRHGWLDDLQSEMGREGYAVGAAVLTAAGIGAPHIRQRLYWVAKSTSQRRCRRESMVERRYSEFGGSSTDSGIPNACESGLEEQHGIGRISRGTDEPNTGQDTERNSGLGDADSDGPQQGCKATTPPGHGGSVDATGWTNPDWIYCRDGKFRPVHPDIPPLVGKFESRSIEMASRVSNGVGRSGDNSVPINANQTGEARVMRLKAYGNAICIYTGVEFIRAFMGVLSEKDL